MSKQRNTDPRRRRYIEEAAFDELERIRAPLYRELERLKTGSTYSSSGLSKAHLCCTRKYNQMRISPLEAQSIARAFARDPELRSKLPAVLERLEEQLRHVTDNEERQSFDCPLLHKKLCLVHQAAKPVGCLAWHPPKPDAEPEEYAFTQRGWGAFEKRDRLNDRFQGPHWKLRVIPLWLKRVFSNELRRRRRRAERGPRRDTASSPDSGAPASEPESSSSRGSSPRSSSPRSSSSRGPQPGGSRSGHSAPQRSQKRGSQQQDSRNQDSRNQDSEPRDGRRNRRRDSSK